MRKIDIPLRKRIGRLLATPNIYHNFPEPVIHDSPHGYRRARCPVDDCDYDGLVSGFNQHYARQHAPDQWQQKSKRIIQVVRGDR